MEVAYLNNPNWDYKGEDVPPKSNEQFYARLRVMPPGWQLDPRKLKSSEQSRELYGIVCNMNSSAFTVAFRKRSLTVVMVGGHSPA